MPVAIENLIPHRAPMRFIDALTDCTETTAVATVCFSADSFAVANGFVLETALVECVAQTVAAALGQRAKNSGQSDSGIAARGMLISLFQFQNSITSAIGKNNCASKSVNSNVSCLMLRVAGEIICDGQPVATGELTLYA